MSKKLLPIEVYHQNKIKNSVWLLIEFISLQEQSVKHILLVEYQQRLTSQIDSFSLQWCTITEQDQNINESSYIHAPKKKAK